MGKRAVAAVAGEMWEPAFGAGFQAPRANQESQVSYSSRPPSARHFHSKAANSAHFLQNRIFGLPDGLKSSFSRKPPKMHPSSDSCAVPKNESWLGSDISYRRCISQGKGRVETRPWFVLCWFRIRQLPREFRQESYVLWTCLPAGNIRLHRVPRRLRFRGRAGAP